LYWQAIIFATQLKVAPLAVERCALLFYRDLIFSALARGEFDTISRWGKKMVNDYPGMTRLTLFKAWLLVPSIFCKEILRAIATLLFKGGAKILHDK
jgi:hypothetical protein